MSNPGCRSEPGGLLHQLPPAQSGEALENDSSLLAPLLRILRSVVARPCVSTREQLVVRKR